MTDDAASSMTSRDHEGRGSLTPVAESLWLCPVVIACPVSCGVRCGPVACNGLCAVAVRGRVWLWAVPGAAPLAAAVRLRAGWAPLYCAPGPPHPQVGLGVARVCTLCRHGSRRAGSRPLPHKVLHPVRRRGTRALTQCGHLGQIARVALGWELRRMDASCDKEGVDASVVRT